ncbi:DUF6350 family protein [Actinotalea sp. M2MS4P-6]|uniref:cell division protein PerM n=1 Tax=Actinotalea sp. M2MS4P-6 TaxID=2983762 RepID=UPI0021E4F8D4|nr:DUF6350 family protein [Actinotalea sp. M2MS4P-6]MCV2395465.1 DUF6350 family protein [Actinotalea sp. M2MS4P-6]
MTQTPPVIRPARPVTEVPATAPRRRGWRTRAAVDGARRRAGGLAARVTDGAPHWTSGLFAGVQGAVLSLLVVVVPAMAAYVATSADPSNDAIGWPRSVAVGAALWLLGQGGELAADGARVALVPLGLTWLVGFAAYASARRSAHPVVAAWPAAIAGHLAVVVVALLSVGQTGPMGVGTGAVVRTLVGATAISAVGLGLGIARRGTVLAWFARRAAPLPRWLRVAVRAGLIAPALLVAAASAVVLTWTLAGRATTGDVVAALGVDAFGGAMLGLAQLTLVPNLVIWAVTWLVGTGFSVGAGTLFSPSELAGGPLPALPLLGSLPTQAGGPLVWVPAVVVAVGVLLALWLHRSIDEDAAWQPLASAVVAALVGAVVLGLLAAASGGPVGPGRFTVVGPPALLVAMDGAVLLLAGLLVAVPASPLVRDAVRRAAGRGWRRLRGAEPGESEGTVEVDA